MSEIHLIPASGGLHDDMPDVRERRMTDDPNRVTCATCLNLMAVKRGCTCPPSFMRQQAHHPNCLIHCDAPKPFVDFSGRTYGAHEIARNLGDTCPHCQTSFVFWGDA